MAEQPFSLVIRGGRAILPDGVARVDIGIRDESIAAIGEGLPSGADEVDASDRIVAPGGVDPHAHIEQVSGAGLLNADTFESATTSAVFGGTTTVIHSLRNTSAVTSTKWSPTITASPIAAR